ncbi:sugar ABC transporter ATP-binding protein [Clostridium sp. SYSU_GA19001]|uniref:sugar ABC transporter ATP-binding protein n=1 Tax=Clostridium caldaquaticum TaxID=2940653 RepID=UPI0020777CFB|nr:sugar ABC transporter ATP-binding protein [Clostridium caldaquaticum]MCM8709980.1 sugar ABC transporter ATP-binding protein [Clostridium caldaquaticum]
MGKEVALSLNNITKRYPGVVAIDNLSMSFYKGEVHALVGENGAGKSTLIKTISGAVVPDEGYIEVDGMKYEKMTPKVSRQHGVEVIYQEFNLIPGLTVAENICFGEVTGKLVDFKVLRKKALDVFETMNISIDPDKLVSELPTAQQQLVEIAKAISKNAKLIVMDEPTAPLTVNEVESLFKIIENLKSRGITIVYISHRMEEIFSISDRVSIMRDGKYIDTKITSETNRKELIQLMVGRELAESYPKRSRITNEKALEVKNLSGNGDKDISFYVNKGEILGFAGLVGAGRTELARMIFGADKLETGEILIDGKKVNVRSPKEAIELGIGLIPEDRKQQGAFLTKGIDWNICISNIRKLCKNGVVDEKAAENQAKKYISELAIKTPYIDQLVMNLSGGNQQKVVLAKVLATDSNIIIFDEPTRGIDVGAKHEIYELMNRLANEGKAIIMISSDMEELLGMSDRIIVLSEGKIAGEVQKEQFDQNYILELASGQ